MLGGKACDIFIELDPIKRPYYNAGDTVSGQVKLNVYSQSVGVKDIQVKLRCDEFSAVAYDDDEKQAMLERREAKHEARMNRRERKGHARREGKDTFSATTPSAAKDHQRHIELTSNVFVANETTGGKHFFEKGEHKFQFRFVLPESIHMLPPHSPVPTRNGLKIGVEWTVKGVAHRAGHLRSSVRAIAEIPVHLTPKNVELADVSRRAELSGQKRIGNGRKWSFAGSLLGIVSVDMAGSRNPPGDQQLIIRFGYPEVGIPQGPLKPNFTLTLESPTGPTNVVGTSVFLVQRCLATVQKKLTMKDAYKNMYCLGQSRVVRVVTQKQEDFSDLVSGFYVRDIFASPFASNFITVSYELRVEVECASEKDNKPQVLVLEVPVNVLGPGLCWPSTSSGEFEATAHVPEPIADHYDSDSSTTAFTNDNTLPTYEEAAPSDTRVIDESTFNDLKR